MGDPRQIQRHPWEISGMRNSGDTERCSEIQGDLRWEDPE
jgi:hypothetical protein